MKTMANYLAFEKFKTSPTTGADMAETIFGTFLSDKGSGITATNDNNRAIADSCNGVLEEGGRTFCERGKLKDSSRTEKKKLSMHRLAFRIDVMTCPFQRIVLASKTVEWNSLRLNWPTSKPIKPSGMPCWSVAYPTFASFANLSAVT